MHRNSEILLEPGVKTTIVSSGPVERLPNDNAEHVYVWDCCQSICVSNDQRTNGILAQTIIFFNVILLVSIK